MSAKRSKAPTNGKNKATVIRRDEQRISRTNKVLAERNQAVAAVGAWVEGGPDFLEHPFALALITEELQAERRRETEESLRRFQDEVRHRVAKHSQLSKWQHEIQTVNFTIVNSGRNIPQQYGFKVQHVSSGEKMMSEGGTAQQCYQESREGMRKVRLRLAACQMSPHEDMASDLPGGKWNVSPSRHKAEHRVVRTEQEVEVEEGEAQTKGQYTCFFTSQHECPLVQQKVREHVMMDTHKPQPDSGFKSTLRETQVLWPLNDQEVKKHRQSQFLMQRRQFMDNEREQVKENNQHRKHLKRTARIKAEKEQIRMKEERRLERAQQLTEAKQMLEERELLILERLKLEEEERAMKLQWKKKEEKRKVSTRFINALRAQMKERLSQEKLELPPLCCCASSFWDSHPDTCANNCVFHNNPKAYAQALHSAILSLDLR